MAALRKCRSSGPGGWGTLAAGHKQRGVRSLCYEECSYFPSRKMLWISPTFPVYQQSRVDDTLSASVTSTSSSCILLSHTQSLGCWGAPLPLPTCTQTAGAQGRPEEWSPAITGVSLIP